jgi:hypothetical protein
MSFVIHYWESGKLCKKYWLHKQQQVLVAGTCKYLQVLQDLDLSQVLDPRIEVAIHANWHRSRSAFNQAVNLQIQIWVTRRSTHAQP